jgi:hypothetical protein
MSTGMKERIQLRKDTICNLSSCVDEELNAEKERLKQRAELRKHLDSLVTQVVAIGTQWRHLIQMLSRDAEADTICDYREIASQLVPLANRCAGLYEHVSRCIAECQSVQGFEGFQRAIDLERHEIKNIVEWLVGWPSHTATQLASLRDSILSEPEWTRDDWRRELQEAR